MTEKSACLFGMIINKDLRIGMAAKTINAVFPGLIPVHEVMLAKLFDPKRVQYPCFGGPKIDCIRATYKHDQKEFLTRTGHVIKGLEHLLIQTGDIHEDLDGEIFIPGMDFQRSSGLIRRGASVPNAVFAMFESPSLKESFVNRLLFLEGIAKEKQGFLRLKHYKLNDHDHLYKFYSGAGTKVMRVLLFVH